MERAPLLAFFKGPSRVWIIALALVGLGVIGGTVFFFGHLHSELKTSQSDSSNLRDELNIAKLEAERLGSDLRKMNAQTAELVTQLNTAREQLRTDLENSQRAVSATAVSKSFAIAVTALKENRASVLQDASVAVLTWIDDKGRYLVHYVAEYGREEVLEHSPSFFDAETGLLSRDNDGNLPFHVAVIHNQPGILNTFLVSVKDTNTIHDLLYNKYNKRGFTFFDEAVARGHIKCVLVVLERIKKFESKTFFSGNWSDWFKTWSSNSPLELAQRLLDGPAKSQIVQILTSPFKSIKL